MVDEMEAREFDEVRLGDYICAPCFHVIKWPRLERSLDEEDLPGFEGELDF
jgi:hypothetical protein